MAVFTAFSMWATAAVGGAWTFAGLSPAVTAALFSAGKAVAWSLASQALARQATPTQKVQAVLSQTDAPRVRAYGRVLLGGVRAFFEADDGKLYQIVVLHHGRVNGLVRFWVDGESVTLNAAGDVLESPFNPDMVLQFRDGSGAGGNYSRVLDEFPSLWTADHRLQGQATMFILMNNPGADQFAEVWPKGSQTLVQAEVQASLVRNMAGTLVYSNNPGLCIRDYLTHADGWRIPLASIDTDSFTAFVARCSDPVQLRAGGTEPRYQLAGTYSLEDAPKDVTSRMLATCDGQIYQTPEGRVGILGGAWSEPDVTITADDILDIEGEPGFDPFSDFNVLKGTHISPDHAFQPTEAPERRDEAALALQGARVEQLDIDMCPSGTQMQRLLKIQWHKRRRVLKGMMRTNLVGLKARFPKGDGVHTIRIAAPEFGVDGVYEVMSHSYSVPDGTCNIGFASIPSTTYLWDFGPEERPLAPTADQTVRPSKLPPVPAGASLTQVPVRLSGDSWGGKLKLTVSSVERTDLTLQAEYADGDVPVTAAGPWASMTGSRFSAQTGILQNEDVYTVRYRWRGQSAWYRAGALTIVANPNVPSSPASFTRVGTEGASFRWINPADNFWKSRVFRNTVDTFSGASFIADVSGLAGEPSTFSHAPLPGAYWYWVVAMNGSSVASPPAGPISITV